MKILLRTAEIAGAAAGLCWRLRLSQVLLPAPKRLSTKAKAVIVRKKLERLGGIYIKLGQFLAMRPDIIPVAYCRELFYLLEDIKPFPFRQAQKIFEHDFGIRLGQAFLRFRPEPIAAASLGQVYWAKTRDGQAVVLKFLRPGVRQMVHRDLKILKISAWLLTKTRIFNHARSLFTDFSGWVEAELNYNQEACNMALFHRHVYHPNYLKIPAVIKKYSNHRILCAEYIPGFTLNKIIKGRARGDRRVLAFLKKVGLKQPEMIDLIFKIYGRQFFMDKYFHADPHPANMILMPDGRIACIDFGVIGKLDKKTTALALRHTIFTMYQQYQQSFAAFVSGIDMAGVKTMERFRQEYFTMVKKEFERLRKVDKKKDEPKHYYGRMVFMGLGLAEKHRARVPENYLTFMRAMALLESTVYYLDPEMTTAQMSRRWRKLWATRVILTAPEMLAKIKPGKLIYRLLDAIERVGMAEV